MSNILEMAHDMAKDLHAAGVMDGFTMGMMDELCGNVIPAQPLCTGKGSRSLTSRDDPITPRIKP